MRIRVRLFARYREAAGRERLELELPEGGTVETAWSAVVDRHPELGRYRPYTLFAVGHDYVAPEHPLRPDDELSLFPPVSGGSSSEGADVTAPSEPPPEMARAKPALKHGDTYRVVDAPLSPEAIAAAVDDPGAGGIVIFSGVVRNETGGRPVKFLEYEAHAPMAEAKMREIGEGLHARWPGVKRVAMLHRIGRLEIGEPSVLIAVSAAHRQEAFEACRYAIDTLKRSVPVWKKEHFEDGEVWVGPQGG
ncbi:MAG TPA: molybdenum cofactor biosynthesis protein MoaE [Methylomirabilota bacterium]|nr:molybdenum cofactor biosynthesis protein MoaE [Methylomirabilota bacterium]